MRELRLNGRLAAAVSFVKKGSMVVDVGTDHGFLPIWLVSRGICQNPIATDLRSGPLIQARRFASEYGVLNSITFRLGNGLEPVSPGEVDTVIITGMGGETIQGILTAAPWVKSEETRLILQPQSKIPEIISWLNRAGFNISDAKLQEDAGRIYLILEAVRGDTPPLTPAGCYVPPVLHANSDPLLERYFDSIIKKLTSVLDGMKRSNASVDRQRIEFTREALEGLYRIRGEHKNES